MGAIIAGPLQANMAKNQEVMQERQKELMMRQRQVQLAVQFSMGKERFLWYQTFLILAGPLMIIGAIRKQNPQIAAPLLPLGFIYAYQYDMFYGQSIHQNNRNKMYRIRQEAERLIKEEPELFYLPKGNEIYTEEQYKAALNIKKQTPTK